MLRRVEQGGFVSRTGLVQAGGRVLCVIAFGLVPTAFVIAFVLTAHRHGFLGFDFRGTLWDPGKAILHGRNPYPPPHADAIRTGNPAIYPPPVMLVVAPLALLPWSVGIAIWLTASMLATAAALWLIGARDWRIYGIAFGSNPFLVGLNHGNLTLVLLLGLAAAWRWRDSPRLAGPIVAALVVSKIFLWPLLLWLLVTRRIRSALYAVCLAPLVTVAAWAAIGFRGFHDYPDLLRAEDDVYARRSASVASLALRAGLHETAAALVALVLGLSLLVAGLFLARRADGDRRMFTAAVIAALVATPILWIYYFVILFVPLALYAPRLARAWWLALGFWLVASIGNLTIGKPPCCRPAGMPRTAWITLTTRPSVAVLITSMAVLALTAVKLLRNREHAVSAVERSRKTDVALEVLG